MRHYKGPKQKTPTTGVSDGPSTAANPRQRGVLLP